MSRQKYKYFGIVDLNCLDELRSISVGGDCNCFE